MEESYRWTQVSNALSGVTTSLSTQFDADGFDVYFLNNEFVQCGVKVSGTPTGTKLKKVLETYLPRLEDKMRPTKPICIVVITDGESDPAENPEENLETVIVNAARRLELAQIPLTQLYIHFIQIGDDLEATASLRHLDDALERTYGVRVGY
ncbi:hypothetical protein K435DRAFT_691266, partial [Dendrothele bispora CBS 962.96]